jgi:hypothetical protein
MFNVFGWGGESAVVEQNVAAAAAPMLVVMAEVANDGQRIEDEIGILDGMELGEEEVGVAADLKALLAEVRQGARDNKVEFDQMRERLEVLEANTFVEAAKWIYEAICELFCKMEKAIVDFGENFPLIGDKANRAREFSDLDKLLEKETQRIDKLAGKNELGDSKAQYEVLKVNAKLDHEARQGALHVKHEKYVDAKYGAGRYKAEQVARDAGKVLTAGEKAEFWEKDANCQYNKIDVKQQMHVAQGKVHGDLLAKKWPELVKAGQYAGKKAVEFGEYVGEKAEAAHKAAGSFVDRVSKGAAPAAGQGRG